MTPTPDTPKLDVLGFTHNGMTTAQIIKCLPLADNEAGHAETVDHILELNKHAINLRDENRALREAWVSASTCKTCNGSGKYDMHDGLYLITRDCPDCAECRQALKGAEDD